MDKRLPAMWLVPLKCRKKAMYSYIYSMCDFVFPCESSMQIRIKFKQETAAVSVYLFDQPIVAAIYDIVI